MFKNCFYNQQQLTFVKEEVKYDELKTPVPKNETFSHKTITTICFSFLYLSSIFKNMAQISC